MKGMVFREFIDMVETEFSLEVADAIIVASELSTEGAYTSVGTYPFEEMLALGTNLSKETGLPIPALLRHFGRHLFSRFVSIHPGYVNQNGGVFGLLRELDSHIHREVRKLYSDAELPSFTHRQIGQDCMELVYTSRRNLADFALGLIEGCIAYFNEAIDVERVDLPEDEHGAHARFTLTRRVHAVA